MNLIYTVVQTPSYYFFSDSVKNKPVVIIFVDEIWRKFRTQKVTSLPTSPVNCSHCEKLKQSFFSNVILSIRTCDWTSSQIMKLRLFSLTRWEIVYYGSPKNSQNDLMYAPVATKRRNTSASQCIGGPMRSTFSKSVRSLLRCRNSVTPTTFSLNLALKSTGSIIENFDEKCCWRKNCCQWSAALLVIVFVFQQDNAPTHHAHDMVELLSHETPPHSLILICGQPTLGLLT